jgi:membrane fusion protein, multidrug efflux system
MNALTRAKPAAHDALSRATPVTRRPRTGYWILTALVVAGLTGGC